MVSVDKPEDNKRFAETHGGSIVVLSDPTKKMAESYGVLMPAGYANRWNFFIDKEGIIKRIEKKVRAMVAGPDVVKSLGELGFAE